MKHLNYAGY